MTMKTIKETPKKYEILYDQSIRKYGRTLYRIRRLSNGEIGGYVESEDNLSHKGNCWIFDDAAVFDRGLVIGDARIFDSSVVSDGAAIGGTARLLGCNTINGDISVSGYAFISHNISAQSLVKISITPKVLRGFPYPVIIADNVIVVGCQVHPLDVWKKKGSAMIKADGFTKREAKSWNDIIVAIAEEHQRALEAANGTV